MKLDCNSKKFAVKIFTHMIWYNINNRIKRNIQSSVCYWGLSWAAETAYRSDGCSLLHLLSW